MCTDSLSNYDMISVKIYTCYKNNLKSKWFLNLTLSDNYISLHVYKKIKWLYKKNKNKYKTSEKSKLHHVHIKIYYVQCLCW